MESAEIGRLKLDEKFFGSPAEFPGRKNLDADSSSLVVAYLMMLNPKPAEEE